MRSSVTSDTEVHRLICPLSSSVSKTDLLEFSSDTRLPVLDEDLAQLRSILTILGSGAGYRREGEKRYAPHPPHRSRNSRQRVWSRFTSMRADRQRTRRHRARFAEDVVRSGELPRARGRSASGVSRFLMRCQSDENFHVAHFRFVFRERETYHRQDMSR